MRPIKAIVFDAYGTLFDIHSVISKIDQLFPGEGKQISELWRKKQLEYTWLRSLMGRYRDFWKVTDDSLAFALKALRLRSDGQTRNIILNEYLVLKPYPEVAAALDQLQHLPLGILSNGTPYMLYSVVNNAGLHHLFSTVLSVDSLKIYKPFSGVYELASVYLGVSREDILYVSANAWDAAGAKAFGLMVCWVNRLNMPFDELDVAPDLIVSNLDQLMNILARRMKLY
ncbi:haloacid dehalogenase type II [Paenibacillus sp. sptzw28]|uniref:haloacid dehalogenase type II n=1 Tax=Paenibacillus sp. sptzw28 TaxID=715179 RepID=UPI001C6E1231|nr:haloacid dehalogenase type II [Paenibacillus sp. sptzw28]QYR19699.1 haloacid dehalogenase type II [Paenibacillus sp. sptzw28]